MDLTLHEGATLLGRRPRTVRAQLARGELKGRKRDGKWLIRRADLPLTDGQRRALTGKIARLHDAVDAAIPEAMRDRIGALALALAELDVFRLGRDVLREMTGAEDLAARQALTDALVAVAEGRHPFDAAIKCEAFTRARSHLSRCITLLLLADPAPDPPAARHAAALEAEVLPRLAGLTRWAEALPSAPRAMA